MSRAIPLTILAAVLCFANAASAQTNGSRSGGFLDDLFGNSNAPPRPMTSGRVAQASDSDLVVRLDRLENEIRQLTGSIEQLQFHNQQLEQTVRKMQEDAAYTSSGGARPAARPQSQQTYPQQAYPQQPHPQQQAYPQQAYPQQTYPQRGAAPEPVPAASPGRRSDVFDPSQNPNAPGVPRTLGGGGSIMSPEPGRQAEAPPVGMPGGREAGAPLDLSNLSQPPEGQGASVIPAEPQQAGSPDGLPPPPPRNPNATGATAALQTQPPTRSPKDEYDLAYGYMLRKDYALAETSFKTFLQQHPGDRLASDATYWLGESMFQRQRYRDAAESFLAVTTKHDKSGKAPDALFRLGQSLAALGEKEAACAALGEVGRKYPRASSGVKQGVVREQKRVHC